MGYRRPNLGSAGGGGSPCRDRIALARALRGVCRLVARSRAEASAEPFDQGSEEAAAVLRDRLLARFAAVDILVNNAVGRSMQSFDDPLAAWQESMKVNATGIFAVSRVFLQTMMARGRGSIINIGSVQGVVAPDFSNYAGTTMTTPPDYHFHKHGMIGLTKYLAATGGPKGVRVNVISPGGFQTESHREPFISQYCRRVFLGRMAQHDDIKGAVVFLASDASAYVTGQNLIVDGGYTC